MENPMTVFDAGFVKLQCRWLSQMQTIVTGPDFLTAPGNYISSAAHKSGRSVNIAAQPNAKSRVASSVELTV